MFRDSSMKKLLQAPVKTNQNYYNNTRHKATYMHLLVLLRGRRRIRGITKETHFSVNLTLGSKDQTSSEKGLSCGIAVASPKSLQATSPSLVTSTALRSFHRRCAPASMSMTNRLITMSYIAWPMHVTGRSCWHRCGAMRGT